MYIPLASLIVLGIAGALYGLVLWVLFREQKEVSQERLQRIIEMHDTIDAVKDTRNRAEKEMRNAHKQVDALQKQLAAVGAALAAPTPAQPEATP